MMVLTRAQREAIRKLWYRSPDGEYSYLAFRRRFHPGIGGDYVFGHWVGMYVGIEPDGHTHT